MNLFVFIPLLFALQFLYWWVGKSQSKNLHTHQDYFLAGKSVSFFPLMMTFLATQVGGGLVLGSANEAYHYGWNVLFYPMGAGLGLIFLGSGVGRRLAGFPASTVAQILEQVYGSVRLKHFASFLSILSLFMVLVGQIIASRHFLASLHIHNQVLFVIFWSLVTLYTVQGGLKAVIATDVIQALVFTTIFLATFAFIWTYKEVSTPLQLQELNFHSPKIYGWLLMPMLFMLIEQDMAQRCFAGGSSQIVSRAAFWAGAATIVLGIIPVFLGVYAKTLGIYVPQGVSVLMEVVQKTTHPWLSALIACAVLAAVISTASSLISAISSNLSSDFVLFRFQKENPVKAGQISTSVICISAIFLSYFSDNIVHIFIQSYDLSVSCLFVPITLAVFRKEGRLLSASLSVALGALSFFCFRILPEIAFPKEILNILLSLLGFGLGELWAFSKKTEESKA